MNETYKLPFTAKEIEDKLTNGCGLELIGTISLPRDGWEEVHNVEGNLIARLRCTREEYELFKNATIVKRIIDSDYLQRDHVYEPILCFVDESTQTFYSKRYGVVALDEVLVAATNLEYAEYGGEFYFYMDSTHYYDTLCPDYSTYTSYDFKLYI